MKDYALPPWMERARSVEAASPSRLVAIHAAIAAAWPQHTVAVSVVRHDDATATAVLTMHIGGRLAMTATVHGTDVEDTLATLAPWTVPHA